MTDDAETIRRHARESGHPGLTLRILPWIPACEGVSKSGFLK
jgi:hypothetical protein